MKIIFLIGPHAVGKMTVGQALERLTGFPLFHNHTTIELVHPFVSYGTPAGRKLVNQVRELFFKAFAESDGAGYILTFVWAFSEPGEREYIESVTRLFEEKGAELCWVELEAGIETRLERNRTENRLLHKPSKRDLAFSERNVAASHEKYRLNSLPGEMPEENYLRIDNTGLSAEEVAQMIFDRFVAPDQAPAPSPGQSTV
ncbi:AAA family ATPase [Roseovarius indicus]|uniref:AAA family ATPase n=2 Tax=Roseovarius indicus TaxID=540747 RepID=UPI0007D94400|nr:AAA family ATPase [Roseovarius indicus]OAO01416.1 shikimate kinase [Roseovarius indicus]